MEGVTDVPLFTWEALTNYFSTKKEDYQRMPMLALGCLFLVGDEFRNFMGYDWSGAVDLGKIGGSLSALPDYWELYDVLTGARKVTALFLELFTGHSREGKDKVNPYENLAQCGLFSLKAFSNGVNLLNHLVDSKVILGLTITPWKFWGCLAGSIYYGNKLYQDAAENYYLKRKDPKKIDELKKEAKETYRYQNQMKDVCSTAMTVSSLAIKIIGLIAVTYTLYGGPFWAKWIAQRTSGLGLSFFATFMSAHLASHFYKEQMKEFLKQNKVSA